jgi:hypothetical protein
LTTPNEDAISQTLLLNRASNALQTHISATLIAPLDSQAAREYNESLNNNIRFLFCGGGDIFYSDKRETCESFFEKNIGPNPKPKISHKKRQTKALDSILCNEKKKKTKTKKKTNERKRRRL